MGNIKEKFRKTVLRFLGLEHYYGTPDDDRNMFINDAEDIKRTKLREYDIWYKGDSDDLLDFYTRKNTLEYNYEPWYGRNKQCYFWCVASTENDIKRTHESLARDMVDTLVAITGVPVCSAEDGEQEALQRIEDSNELWKQYECTALPMTLVEGWGCWKISWDKGISPEPIITYYRAESVDFIRRLGHMIGIVFRDYYTDGENRKYMLSEIRSIGKDTATGRDSLFIKREIYRVDADDDELTELTFDDVPEFKGTPTLQEVEGLSEFLAVPTIIYEDPDGMGYGRSIYAGKIDKLDDFDQAASQCANAMRRSTVQEYFDTDFLERDRQTGLPIQPKCFDRKFTMFHGAKDSNGNNSRSDPVQVTQPKLDFEQLETEMSSIKADILDGVLSPATLGIDVSRRDNATAQREKEKVTVFTRNRIISSTQKQISALLSQSLLARELMLTGKTQAKASAHPVSVKYGEFANDSFESRLDTLGKAYESGIISTGVYLDKLYGDSMTPAEKEKEGTWLDDRHNAEVAQEMASHTSGNPAVKSQPPEKAPEPAQA
jgi:hypothetical protein